MAVINDDAIQEIRDAIKRVTGMGDGQRTGTSGSSRTIYKGAEILAFPVDMDSYDSLQVLDDGPDFGKFYFLNGFSLPGGSDIIR